MTLNTDDKNQQIDTNASMYCAELNGYVCEENDASAQVFDSTESNKTTNETVANPGVLGNIINTLVGVAEVAGGIVGESLWPQGSQSNEETQSDADSGEEFSILESKTWSEMVEVLNKAKNHGNYEELGRVIEKEDVWVDKPDRDNLGKFFFQQLDLTTQTEHHNCVRTALGKRIEENGSCYYAAKELALLAIAANDTLVEKYAETHKDMLFKQDEDLDRLLIGVGGPKYIKSLLKHLEKERDSVTPWHDICEKLKRALSTGNQCCIEAILDKFSNTEAEIHSNLQSTYSYSSKLLHYVIQRGFKDVAKVIVDHKIVEINSIDNNGLTPLHYAVPHNDSELVSLLIKNGADVDIKDKLKGNTALHYAARNNKLEMVKLLVKAGADWNIKNSDGKTALEFVGVGSQSNKGDEANKSKVMGFLQDLNKTTPLCYAVEHDNSYTIARLLEKHVDINAKNEGGWTPLSRAIVRSNLEFVKLLLDHKASVNATIQNGDNTHLSWAIQRNGANERGKTWEIVNLLLESGAQIGNSEFKQAISSANLKVIELLVSKGAAINQEGIKYAEESCKRESHITGYPGGLENEKKIRAEIWGFLQGILSAQKTITCNSKKTNTAKKNVPAQNGGSDVLNIGTSAQKSISGSCDGGEMNTKENDIPEELVGYIKSHRINQLRSFVERNKTVITESFLKMAIEALALLRNDTDNKTKKHKNELARSGEIVQYFIKELKKNGNWNTRATSAKPKEGVAEQVAKSNDGGNKQIKGINISSSSSNQAKGNGATASEISSDDKNNEVESNKVEEDTSNDAHKNNVTETSTTETSSDSEDANPVILKDSITIEDNTNSIKNPEQKNYAESPAINVGEENVDQQQLGEANNIGTSTTENTVDSDNLSPDQDDSALAASIATDNAPDAFPDVRLTTECDDNKEKFAATVENCEDDNSRPAGEGDQQCSLPSFPSVYSPKPFSSPLIGDDEYVENNITNEEETLLGTANGEGNLTLKGNSSLQNTQPKALETNSKQFADQDNGDTTPLSASDIENHRSLEQGNSNYSDSHPAPVPSSLVVNKKAKQSDIKTNGGQHTNQGNGSTTAIQNTQKSKWPTIAISTLAVAVLTIPAALVAHFVFQASLLATGITAGVGACFLVAAAVMYYCTRPSNSLENSSAEAITNEVRLEA